MIPLESRRRLASALLAFDLIKGNIRVQELCDRIRSNSSIYSTRGRRPLVEDLHHTDFAFNDVVSRAIRDFNEFSDLFDPEVSKATFKSRILSKMKTIFDL